METKTTRKTKADETPETQNRDWGFFGTCVSNGHTDADTAWLEAMAAMTDPKGPFQLSAMDARWLLDATWGRHLADQVVGEDIPKAIAELARKHGWAKDARNFVRRHINPNLAPLRGTRQMEANSREDTISGIAHRVLGVRTLATQNSNGRDFYDLAVWTIREALDAAYEAGRQSVAR
jgi:hypothetical protein